MLSLVGLHCGAPVGVCRAGFFVPLRRRAGSTSRWHRSSQAQAQSNPGKALRPRSSRSVLRWFQLVAGAGEGCQPQPQPS